MNKSIEEQIKLAINKAAQQYSIVCPESGMMLGEKYRGFLAGANFVLPLFLKAFEALDFASKDYDHGSFVNEIRSELIQLLEASHKEG